ncbi:MAG: hypothetical protein V4653_08095, partial [Pseudomonadota bacterium]
LDASLSTARAAVDGSGPVLHSARLAALLLASALEAEDHGCAVQAFSSNGRHQVLMQPVKAFQERCADARVIARAQALKSRWSTRIGAAARHAAAAVRGRPEPVKLVLLVTDGEPHDVDVHDPRYLVDDLRHAVRESARHGVRVACVNLGGAAAGAGDPLQAAFPPGAYRVAASLVDFPGKDGAWTALHEVTDAALLAQGVLWMIREAGCANRAFNLTNGDAFRWCDLWPFLAERLGVAPGRPRRMTMRVLMADKEPVWERVRQRHGLTLPLSQVASWEFADFFLNMDYDVIASMTAMRSTGFPGFVDSWAMFDQQIKGYRAARVLPPIEG